MTERTTAVLERHGAPARRGPKPRLTREEARELTDRIKLAGHEMWLMVAEAHTRRAWTALGYSNWKDYVESELRMSESRSYQLLDTGKVIRVLHEVYGTDSSTLEAVPTQRETAKAVSQLPKLKEGLREAKKTGASAAEALHGAIRALPIPFPRDEKGLEESMARHPAGKKRGAQIAGPLPQGASVCPTCGGRGYVT